MSDLADLRAENERLKDEIATLREVRVLDHDQIDVTDKITDLQNERDLALHGADQFRKALEQIRDQAQVDSDTAAQIARVALEE